MTGRVAERLFTAATLQSPKGTTLGREFAGQVS